MKSIEEEATRQGRIRLGELEAEKRKVSNCENLAVDDLAQDAWDFDGGKLDWDGYLAGYRNCYFHFDCGATSPIAMADRVNELLEDRRVMDAEIQRLRNYSLFLEVRLAGMGKAMDKMVAHCGVPNMSDALRLIVDTYRNYKKGIQ